uniref:non-specific serine/threonine protein kinase n=1 Tax=Anopheles farauti TaxID=69004 RepID=A0A182QH80_9DIPT
MTDTMQSLPEGFYHVGDGRLSMSEEYLRQLKTPKPIAEVYDVEETWIAKGMYGIVRSAIAKQSGIGYAAKFLRRRRRGQCCLNEIYHEIAVLMLCADSDHVVKLESVHETRSEVALILELATGGELQTLIDEQGQLSEQKTRVCMREILKALQHMHSKSIAHLDLKPQNILLAGKSVDDGLKLCDFGIARFIGEKNKIYEIVGTPDYVAPEVLHYDPLSLQTDIWSIGVVAYVLLTGLSPFGGDSKQETFLNVTKCSLTFPDDLFEGISNDAIDFIRSALRIKPKERMTVNECLEHRWLKEDTICPIGEMLAARTTSCNWQEADSDDEQSHNDTDHDRPNGSYGVLSSSSSSSPPPPVCLQSHNHYQTSQSPPLSEVVVDERSTASREEELPEQEENGQQKEHVKLGEDNKENVMVVSRSLFPDAPTTPKVSRKTLPVEPLNDGGADSNTNDNTLLAAPSILPLVDGGIASSPTHRCDSEKMNPSVAATAPTTSSCTFTVVSSGCRTTVATTMALCGLKCTESSVSSAGNHRHLAAANTHKPLSQCDKDVIIC